MIIGIVSDTHGEVECTRRAVRALQSRDEQLVIHCGDIGSADIVGLFQPWPAHFVFGNVDSQPGPLRNAIRAAGQTCHERFGSLELAGRKIAFLHGDDSKRLRETIEGGLYDLVCYGHTHKAEQHPHRTTIVLNPGAVYRARPHTIAIVGLPQIKIEHVPLD